MVMELTSMIGNILFNKMYTDLFVCHNLDANIFFFWKCIWNTCYVLFCFVYGFITRRYDMIGYTLFCVTYKIRGKVILKMCIVYLIFIASNFFFRVFFNELPTYTYTIGNKSTNAFNLFLFFRATQIQRAIYERCKYYLFEHSKSIFEPSFYANFWNIKNYWSFWWHTIWYIFDTH